jgi:hypothetical protein
MTLSPYCRQCHIQRKRRFCTSPARRAGGVFLAGPLVNRVLTAPDEVLHVRIMDEGKVLLVNLCAHSKGPGAQNPGPHAQAASPTARQLIESKRLPPILDI